MRKAHTSTYGGRYLIGDMPLKRRVWRGTLKKWYFVWDGVGESLVSVDSTVNHPAPMPLMSSMSGGEVACSFLQLLFDSYEGFFHSTFLGVWVKSSGTCHLDTIAVFSCRVAVFVAISKVEFSTTLSASLQGHVKADLKKTTLAVIGEK